MVSPHIISFWFIRLVMHAVGRQMTHGKIKAVCDTKLFQIRLEIQSYPNDSQPNSGPVLSRSLNILNHVQKRGEARQGRISMEVR